MTLPAARLVRLYGRISEEMIWMRLVAVLAFVVVLAGCGNAGRSGTGAPSLLVQTPQAASETPAEPVTTTPSRALQRPTKPAKRTGTVIKSANSDLGRGIT